MTTYMELKIKCKHKKKLYKSLAFLVLPFLDLFDFVEEAFVAEGGADAVYFSFCFFFFDFWFIAPFFFVFLLFEESKIDLVFPFLKQIFALEQGRTLLRS